MIKKRQVQNEKSSHTKPSALWRFQVYPSSIPEPWSAVAQNIEGSPPVLPKAIIKIKQNMFCNSKTWQILEKKAFSAMALEATFSKKKKKKKRVQVIIKWSTVVITQQQIRLKKSRHQQVVEQYLHFHRIDNFKHSGKMKGCRSKKSFGIFPVAIMSSQFLWHFLSFRRRMFVKLYLSTSDRLASFNGLITFQTWYIYTFVKYLQRLGTLWMRKFLVKRVIIKLHYFHISLESWCSDWSGRWRTPFHLPAEWKGI